MHEFRKTRLINRTCPVQTQFSGYPWAYGGQIRFCGKAIYLLI